MLRKLHSYLGVDLIALTDNIEELFSSASNLILIKKAKIKN